MNDRCSYGKTCTPESPCVYCERDALRKLVREMAPFVRGSWCEERRERSTLVWPDWDKADEILNRPEVKKILEKE